MIRLSADPVIGVTPQPQKQTALLLVTLAAAKAFEGDEACIRLMERFAVTANTIGLQWVYDDYRAKRRKRMN